MSDQDIFNNETNTTNTSTASPDALFADQLAAVKGPDGTQKYDSVEKALEALGHSQKHIAQLEAEKKAMEAEKSRLTGELEKLGTVDDFVSKLQTANTQTTSTPTTPEVAGLDENAVAQIVNSVLQKNNQEQVEQANLQTIRDALVKQYGDQSKANEIFNVRAQQLNTTPAQLLELSKQNPQMVLTMLGTSAQTAPQPTTPSVNIPLNQSPSVPTLEKPEKSLLMGASSKDQMDYMKKIKDSVYAELGVVT